MSRGELVSFDQGSDIIKIGDRNREVYLLLSGKIDILDDRGKAIDCIDKVEIFGEMAYLKKIPRVATVRVTSDKAATIRLEPNLFKEINEKFPSFHATVLKKMERRWEALKAKRSSC